jgi:hypothetical protein
MAHRSDRRGDTPITRLAYEVVQTIGSPRADSMMARSHRLHPRGRRYVGSLTRCSCGTRAATSTSLRARQGPAAASGGALRAALTRTHAVL